MKYDDMKFAELQALCRERGIKAARRKVDMIAALNASDSQTQAPAPAASVTVKVAPQYPEFTFVGDQRVFPNRPKWQPSNPDFVVFRGVRFPLNVPVRVDDPELAAKLANNSHFR